MLSSASLKARPAGPARSRKPCPQIRATAAVEQAAGAAKAVKSYYVVQNVFKVKPESATDFENVWKTRESHLKEMPGFIRFAMLKCTNIPGKYVSQTHWATKEDFENWARSSQFKASHGQGSSNSNRPNTMTMLEGPPAPELYETVTITE